MSTRKYTNKDIKNIRWNESVRLRPGMYIGWINQRGFVGLLKAMLTKFVGELRLDLFYRLQKMQIINSAFSYFSDFRWDLQTIEKKIEQIEKMEHKSNADVAYLLVLLNKAIQTKKELITYSD